jgi:hypothetical protein
MKSNIMKSKVDQKTINFVVQQVDSQILRNDILVDLCEQYGMNWQEAEELVLDVEISRKDKDDPELLPFLPTLGVGVLIFAVIYFLAKFIIATGTITIQGFDLVILFAVIGTLIMFLGLFLHSDRQNSIKESFRCPSCGNLTNYKGNENSILTPRYMESTYYTRRKRLKTWRDACDPLLQDSPRLVLPSPGGSHNIPEWDEFSLFEITEFCRNCKQVRNEFRKVIKVGQHRHSRDPDVGP